MRLIVKIFANTLAVILAAYLLPGIEVKDFMNAVLVAIVLAVFK